MRGLYVAVSAILTRGEDDGIVVVEVGQEGVSVRRASVPQALHEVLGREGTTALVQVMNEQEDEVADRVARAVVRELEPRFARIEARLDRCATKDRVATRADVRWLWVGQALLALLLALHHATGG